MVELGSILSPFGVPEIENNQKERRFYVGKTKEETQGGIESHSKYGGNGWAFYFNKKGGGVHHSRYGQIPVGQKGRIGLSGKVGLSGYKKAKGIYEGAISPEVALHFRTRIKQTRIETGVKASLKGKATYTHAVYEHDKRVVEDIKQLKDPLLGDIETFRAELERLVPSLDQMTQTLVNRVNVHMATYESDLREAFDKALTGATTDAQALVTGETIVEEIFIQNRADLSAITQQFERIQQSDSIYDLANNFTLWIDMIFASSVHLNEQLAQLERDTNHRIEQLTSAVIPEHQRILNETLAELNTTLRENILESYNTFSNEVVSVVGRLVDSGVLTLSDFLTAEEELGRLSQKVQSPLKGSIEGEVAFYGGIAQTVVEGKKGEIALYGGGVYTLQKRWNTLLGVRGRWQATPRLGIHASVWNKTEAPLFWNPSAQLGFSSRW